MKKNWRLLNVTLSIIIGIILNFYFISLDVRTLRRAPGSIDFMYAPDLVFGINQVWQPFLLNGQTDDIAAERGLYANHGHSVQVAILAGIIAPIILLINAVLVLVWRKYKESEVDE